MIDLAALVDDDEDAVELGAQIHARIIGSPADSAPQEKSA
jgi:hypothetical protein